MKLRVRPARNPLRGRYRPPGDKSVSHRAAILGGLADGETRISGFLEAADTRATLAAMEALGAQVERRDGDIRIRGGSLSPPDGALDLGNSGTGIRLLAGALAGRAELIGSCIELTGDESLSRRPMGRIIEPLTAMGARIEARDGRAPLVIHPAPLRGAEHAPEVASAQVKSALLLAGLCAQGRTVVREPSRSRDHTERLLPAFRVAPEVESGQVAVTGPAQLSGTAVAVPGDLSSAAFILAAAVLVPGSRVDAEPVGLNPTRDGVLRVLQSMLGDSGTLEIRQQVVGGAGAEPVGMVQAGHGSLAGITVPEDWVPAAIDEFPVIMALAAAARGDTEIRGAAELRVKESDRLAVMCAQLARLGVEVTEHADGATIRGGPVSGGNVDAAGDHRIAMALAVLALVAEAPVTIDGAEWIATSYPGFVDDLRALGAELDWIPE